MTDNRTKSTGGSRSDRLNPTDATLWEIKRDPELRTTIVAVAMLDRVPDWDTLNATVKRVIDGMPRLRQRVEEATLGLGRPRWTDTEVDLPFHLRRMTARQPGTVDAVLELSHPLAAEEFDNRVGPRSDVVAVALFHALEAGPVELRHLRVADGSVVPQAVGRCPISSWKLRR